MGAVETHFRNDPTPKSGSLAARETSETSAALPSLTQIIFAIRRKRWLRLGGRRSIQAFRGRKLPKPRSTGAHTAVNPRANESTWKDPLARPWIAVRRWLRQGHHAVQRIPMGRFPAPADGTQDGRDGLRRGVGTGT